MCLKCERECYKFVKIAIQRGYFSRLVGYIGEERLFNVF